MLDTINGQDEPIGIHEVIQQAEAVLRDAPGDDESGVRWKAVIAVGEFIQDEPEAVWEFVRRWGSCPDEDLRSAIATCILEHLLEYHYELLFPRVKELAMKDELFAHTFSGCWKFGQTELPANEAKFDALQKLVIERSQSRRASADVKRSVMTDTKDK